MTPPRRLSGRYELGELLGLGGMSEVHLAHDLRLHRDVAVKLLRVDLGADPSMNLRFKREAQHAAALNHPAIAAVYDTGEVDSPNGPLPYIVMEYVEGVTLRDLLRTGPLRARRAVEVVAEACEALTFSHQRGIIHRDIKPANIMVRPGGSVKVVDFGIAKAMAEGHSVTQTGAVIGTAHYLSPEQARGDPVDARTDVYSLGCVFYEMLSGATPFVGDSAVSVAYQHVGRAPVPPSTHDGRIPPALDAVVLKAMAKNPDDRYQAAADLRTDLVRWRRGQTPYAALASPDDDHVTAPVTSVLPDPGFPTEHLPPPQETRRGEPAASPSTRRWLIPIAALVVLTVAATIGVKVVSGDRRDVTAPDVSTSLGPTNGPDPSTSPAGIPIPDVSSLTYGDAVRKLTAAGFQRFRKVSLPSPPELKDRVLGTNPLTNQSSAAGDEITIVLGSGRQPTRGDAHG